MTRSHRSRHGPKSSPLQHKKQKKTRRSVAFASSPTKPRHRNEDSVDDNIFDDDDDTENSLSDSESLFLWDEESTLLDALMDKPKVQLDDSPSVIALTGHLRDAFVDRGQVSKTEMAHIFVSTNTEVKNYFKTLDEIVEPTIGKELIRFNIACKEEERQCLGFAEIIDKFKAHNAACIRLEEQIAAHFAERDALYTNFEEFAEKTLNPVLERLKDLPARNERWMTQMFEDLKVVEKKYKKIAISKELQGYLGLGELGL